MPFTLGIEGTLLLKITPADGYIGSDEPDTPPAITLHPQSQSGSVGGAVFTLTCDFTPANAEVRWQWRNPTYQVPVEWKDISGATEKSYTMHDGGTGLVAEQNDDRFRVRITTSGNDPVYSNEATITVT